MDGHRLIGTETFDPKDLVFDEECPYCTGCGPFGWLLRASDISVRKANRISKGLDKIGPRFTDRGREDWHKMVLSNWENILQEGKRK